MSNARAGVDASNRKFAEAFGRQDAAGLTSLYTSNAVVMPPNAEALSGADNITAMWKAVFDMGVKSATLETVDFDDLGDTAIERGSYQMLAEGGAVADTGKYLVVWKNDGGTWRLHWDMFSSNQPAG